MDTDIGPLLDKWPYDEEANTRRITGHDGRQKLQVRLPLGVEQYEVDGRPDGVKPEGFDSYLDYYCAVAEREGRHWQLSAKAFGVLHEEGLLYYFRYLLFFRMGEYDLCVRDTERNLRLADFVVEHSGSREMAQTIEQYRPYIVRMRAVSLAVKTARDGAVEDAQGTLAEAIDHIETMSSVDTPVFRLEKARSLVALRDLSNQLRKQHAEKTDPVPIVTEEDRLRAELNEAVSSENYERAATLRDEIRRLGDGLEIVPPDEL